MDRFIAVIDYGLGNLRSVSKALEAVGARVKVTYEPEDVARACAIVLPGVGAFKRAMDNLIRLEILPSLLRAIKKGRPFLGICLGLQILFTESEEHGTHKGLDVIKGKVKKFGPGMKIPHMGWNQVKIKKPVTSNQKPDLFKNIPDKSYFYFVHSYYVEPEDKDVIVSATEYGDEFTSAVNKDNIWGVQFHPERSEKLGLKVLENFYRNVS
jgi:glutamine amidotransferase